MNLKYYAINELSEEILGKITVDGISLTELKNYSVTIEYAGDTMPDSLDGIVFTYLDEDYFYVYYAENQGWNATVKDKTKTSYAPIRQVIFEKPITSMQTCFYECSNLTDVSQIVIPNTVINMGSCFADCTSLKDASKLIIPSSVKDMEGTFGSCSQLEKAPVIPMSVEDLHHCFSESNVKVVNYEGTVNQIKLVENACGGDNITFICSDGSITF